jgi:hypothetical protein
MKQKYLLSKTISKISLPKDSSISFSYVTIRLDNYSLIALLNVILGFGFVFLNQYWVTSNGDDAK